MTDRDWAGTSVVLELDFRPPSISFRAHAGRVGCQSVIDWAMSRLRLFTASDAALAIFTERFERHGLQTVLQAQGVHERVCSGRGELQDFGQLVSEIGCARLLLVDLTAALLPPECFALLLREHVTAANDATVLSGTPCAVEPLIVEADVVTTLADSRFGLPRRLRDALVTIEGIVRSPEHDAPRIDRVIAIPEHEQALRRWPIAIQIRNPEDVAILDRAVRACPEEPLSAWAEASRWIRRASPPLRMSDAGDSRFAARVLFAQAPSAFTGVEQVMLLLAGRLREHSDGLFESRAFIAHAGVLSERLEQAGVDVTVAGVDFSGGSVDHYIRSLQYLRAARPAIVHAHAVVGLPFCCAIAQEGLPLIQHVHVASSCALAILTDQMAHASAVVAVSEFVKRRIVRFGVDPERIRVIHNGVPSARHDSRVMARRALSQALDVPADAGIVLVPARYARNKRHDVALSAFAEVAGALPSTCLLLAGECAHSERAVFEETQLHVERLGLQARVRMLGFRPDMARLYAAADIVLLPSEDDPLPLTILEAMAAGTPVVAAHSGGIPEMVAHEVTGVLVEPGRSHDFAAALVRLLSDHAMRERLSRAALERCAREFGVARFLSQITDLYEAVLHRRDAPTHFQSGVR